MRCLVNARPAIRTLLILVLGLGLVAGVSACGNGTSSTTGQRGPVTASVGDLDPVPIGPEPTPVLPATVTSFDGSPVTVTDTSRIIAADRYGTLAQTVVALGLRSKLVGRSNSAAFPAVKDLPTVSSGSGTLSVEAVAALRPSVFLTDTTAVTPALREQLKALGITVVYFDDKRTLDGVVPQIQAVADALGVSQAGKALAKRTTDEIAAATASVPHQDAKPKIAFLYLRSTAITMIFGPGSGAESLISAIGGIDAATASGITQDFLPITSEAMIAAAPDVLLVMSDGLASVGGVDGLEKVPGVAQTPAGRDRRVVDMNDAVLLSFGPNTGRVLTALIKAVYGTPTA
ncbi:ABC transporter substrate-binding protein [Nocardia sp. CDC153]|uniref:heme/hemin ABC transporter substrate-binding protein n=1 Tax=Nocardia sp. CDC153 TaxID=3112167 RepID=UPI002DBD7D17|nr:ABC transporter substrate-binding protein [Nocardia sp. CDC153]MEC3956316.1 ABC transporter substrate-binding protein [Nocardia sp. CDC153]